MCAKTSRQQQEKASLSTSKAELLSALFKLKEVEMYALIYFSAPSQKGRNKAETPKETKHFL